MQKRIGSFVRRTSDENKSNSIVDDILHMEAFYKLNRVSSWSREAKIALERVFKIRKSSYDSEHYQRVVAAVFKVIRLIDAQIPKECIVRIILIKAVLVGGLSHDDLRFSGWGGQVSGETR